MDLVAGMARHVEAIEPKMPDGEHENVSKQAAVHYHNRQDTRAIQLYLGHKNIQPTVRYTGLSPQRFRDFWRD